LHVALNNGDHLFFRTRQCEETKGIIHSLIILAIKALLKSDDVKMLVSYIRISYNFIIKNYVNRKITSYIYLWIFTKSIQLHVMGKCEKNFCL